MLCKVYKISSLFWTTGLSYSIQFEGFNFNDALGIIIESINSLLNQKNIFFPLCTFQCCSQNDNWGAHIHIFVFCFINFFWNRLFLWYVNTNIWICAPPPQLLFWLRHWYVFYNTLCDLHILNLTHDDNRSRVFPIEHIHCWQKFFLKKLNKCLAIKSFIWIL